MFDSLINYLKELFGLKTKPIYEAELEVIPDSPINEVEPIPAAQRPLEFADLDWGFEALKYKGTKEVSGKNDNPVIVSWYKDVVGKVYHDETANCMAFMMAVLKRSGYQFEKTLWAADIKKVGTACSLKVGCMVGKKSTAAASGVHVTFCKSINLKNGTFEGFGANQGNETKSSTFLISDVLYTRWPVKA